MRGIVALSVLVALPALAVLGHDAYLTYQGEDITSQLVNKEMMFSDVGYLWTHYSPESYQWARDNLEKSTWTTILTPLLEETSVFVAAVPAILTYSLLLILRLFHLPPFDNGTKGFSRDKKSAGYGVESRSKKKFTYKRK